MLTFSERIRDQKIDILVDWYRLSAHIQNNYLFVGKTSYRCITSVKRSIFSLVSQWNEARIVELGIFTGLAQL